MYQFYHDSTNSVRFHESISLQLSRLSFTNEFQAGRIQGSLLRGALGLDEDHPAGSDEGYPWYYKMMHWGYPPGYYSTVDPKTRCRSRILGANPVEVSSADDLVIFGEGENELVHDDDNGSSHALPSVTKESVEPQTERRWVVYRTSLFLSDILPVYAGSALPEPQSTKSDTFTSDREDLWQKVLREETAVVRKPPPEKVPLPPWRLPGALRAQEFRVFVPHSREALRPSSHPNSDISVVEWEVDEADEQDMDVSD